MSRQTVFHAGVDAPIAQIEGDAAAPCVPRGRECTAYRLCGRLAADLCSAQAWMRRLPIRSASLFALCSRWRRCPQTTATHRRDSARAIPAGADAPAANWPRDIRPLCFRRRGCPLCRARPAAAAARSIPAGADVRITRTRGFSAAVLLRAHGPRCTIAVPRAPAAGSSVRARTAPSMAVSEHRSRPFARASTARGMRRRAMRASARRTHAPRAAGCGIREEASAGVAFRDPSWSARAQSPVQATASRRSMKSFQPTASRKAKRSGP